MKSAWVITQEGAPHVTEVIGILSARKSAEQLNGCTPSCTKIHSSRTAAWRFFIGFEDSGRLILSPVACRPSLGKMGINVRDAVNVGGFTSGQRAFLEFHRNAVLLQAIRT